MSQSALFTTIVGLLPHALRPVLDDELFELLLNCAEPGLKPILVVSPTKPEGASGSC